MATPGRHNRMDFNLFPGTARNREITQNPQRPPKAQLDDQLRFAP